MPSGKIVDIRTGRALAKTRDLNITFINYVVALVEKDIEFYLVYGRCRHQDVRVLINDLRESLNDVEIIYDPRMPPDKVWVFEGDPAELGFAV